MGQSLIQIKGRRVFPPGGGIRDLDRAVKAQMPPRMPQRREQKTKQAKARTINRLGSWSSSAKRCRLSCGCDKASGQYLPEPARSSLLFCANSFAFWRRKPPKENSVASCRRCFQRTCFEGGELFTPLSGSPSDDRNWLGLIPVHLLNACVKEPTSRYPRSHVISETDNARSLR